MAMDIEMYSESMPACDANILRGVTAYVEVWSGNENRCECVKTELISLGARVEEKFTPKVTHVLFNEGSLSTYKKAKKRNIPLVSVLWIEESKRLLSRACEESFRALHLDKYEEPDIFSSPSGKRPRRNMPCRRGARKKKRPLQDKENEPYETYFNPEIFDENAALVKDGIIGTLEHVTGENFSTVNEDDIFPCSQMSADINEPLTKKLYNRFLAEVKEDSVEHSSSRHSCPPEFTFPENTSESVEFKVPIGTAQKWSNQAVRMETSSYKKAQIPITFYFQTAMMPNRLPSLVFTGMHHEEVQMLRSVVEKIGGFQVDKNVGGRCRHVVCGYPPKRTMNMLRGVARGCWILSKEWVLKSLDNNSWLNEAEFELDYFLPAIKKVRMARERSMPSIFRHYLFSRYGPFYVAASCSSPPTSEVRELLLLCGGYVVSCSRAAKIVIVGQEKSSATGGRQSKDQIFVTEKWVLDSISEDSVCSFISPYVVETRVKRKSS
ncbi:microcephalin [Ischnura elegans]|uniref:microcephalin n=1 Tax=Ischnura elegans TaxID=197161 RepID=UPI001ED8BC07|nr:microcephalin [Ischnura elegans]